MKTLFSAVRVLALAAVGTMIAAAHQPLRFDIPFDFVVNGKTMPAGEYVISDSIGAQVVYVHSADGKISAVAITNAVNPVGDDVAQAAFLNVNGTRYLKNVARGGVVRELPRTPPASHGVLAYVRAALR